MLFLLHLRQLMLLTNTFSLERIMARRYTLHLHYSEINLIQLKGAMGMASKTTTNIIPMTPPAVRQYYIRLLFSIGIRSEKKRRQDFSVTDSENGLKLAAK
jgi:hypothetical protein